MPARRLKPSKPHRSTATRLKTNEKPSKAITLRRAKFGFDDGPDFDGWHNNRRRWNGWGMPYFTKEVMSEVIKHFPGSRYVREGDMFVVNHGDREGPDMVVRSEMTTPSGEALYDMGIGLCWNVTEPK